MSPDDGAVVRRVYDFGVQQHATKVDRFLFLSVTPDVALERVKSRGRVEELGISPEYLTALTSKYEDFFRDPRFHEATVAVIDADKPADDVFTAVRRELWEYFPRFAPKLRSQGS